jgi:Na+/H+-dicarboxylate symporter/ABC-type amino acid transport substrate-binding protein
LIFGRFTIGYQVLLAVVLGILVGLFFGPYCSILKPVGDIFIMLLQMVVLPYICFSLIHGLGSMTPEIGKRLFRSGWPFLAALWGLTFVLIFLLGHLIPKPLVAFIGNATPGKNADLSKNFLSFLVPENPFYDLVNNVVPAVAIFGLIVGAALMHLGKKEPLLGLLEEVNLTIEKILKWLAILSPIGAFAHIAVAVGTVRFEDLYKLEFYVISFIVVSLFVTFWLLPVLLSSLTPLTYREVLKGFKTVCLLPFVTGLPTIALPFINYYMKKLGATHEPKEPDFHSTSQTVMPIAYSFGQIGNCMILFFILFISFYYRHPFVGSEKALLSILTVPMSIGSSATSINAVSFLINQLSFPSESIELFTETAAITLNFQVLMSVASILTLIILTLYAYYGLLQIKWKQLFVRMGSSLALFTVLVLSAKQLIHLGDNYENLYMNLTLHDVISNPVSARLIPEGEGGTPRPSTQSESEPLESILRTGVLKVGYEIYNIPYCYQNDQNQLVGYDIAFAYQLARDLDCSLEFVPIHLEKMGEELSAGRYDLVMAATIMDEERIVAMDFTHPYTEQDNVLVVPLKQRSGFVNLDQLINQPGVKIGAVGGYKYVLQRHFPNAIAVTPTHIDPQLTHGQVDAWVWSHIPAFIWCLSHPGFVVMDYHGLIGKRYFSYPVRSGATDFTSFLNNWLALKDQSGFKHDMYQYWIEGETPKKDRPRWSILRDVLHWVQ